MARCKSVDDLSQIISEADELIMDSNDSDSEIDVTDDSNEDCDAKKESEDAELLIIDDDSDAENDITDNSNDVNNEGKDYNSDSSENTDNEKLISNAGPVLSLQCLHEDEEEKNDNAANNCDYPPVKIVAVNGSSDISSSKASHPQSAIPARNNWEGAHNFKVKIQCNDVPKRSESAFYSELQQKLYVSKDSPFKVLIFAENVPRDCRIRATAVFSMVEHSYEVVQRCPTHAQADFSKGNPAYEHFVQCFSDAAAYVKHPDSGKMSVSVPYEKPQEGVSFTTYLFKLTCFNSCSGGINRRPFMLVFTLEKDNIPLGRQTIEAKVCACPARDFKVDDDREHRKKSKTNFTSKSSSEAGAVNSKYTISVKDPELYLFLKQMKCLYELTAYSSKMKPDT